MHTEYESEFSGRRRDFISISILTYLKILDKPGECPIIIIGSIGREDCVKSIYIFAIVLLAFTYLPVSATIINIPDDYPTIQQGINASTDGDTVLVQPGTYVENINFNGHNITLGSLFLTTGDTTYIAETIIDGDQNSSVITIENLESGARIVGLSIRNGSTPSGVFCVNSLLTIQHCFISENTGAARGGGIAIVGSDVLIEECDIAHNRAVPFDYYTITAGGGIYCDNSNVRLIRSNIGYNSAHETLIFHYPGHGGGIACQNGSILEMIDNEVEQNAAGEGGSGIDCRDSDIIMLNNIVLENRDETESSGGGVYCSHSYSLIINNVVLLNGTTQNGGGIEIINGSGSMVTNNIIRENLPYQVYSPNVAISYSNIEGGWEGEGNIDIDPLFRDPDNGDFHLMSTACGDPDDSPCIDAGYPGILDSLLDCSWGLGTIVSDMGAFAGGDSVTVGTDDYIERLPSQFALFQNYPNPFNAVTVIRYSLPEPSDVVLEVYDILGRKVEMLVNERQAAGFIRPSGMPTIDLPAFISAGFGQGITLRPERWFC
jgi:hypothetical protein